MPAGTTPGYRAILADGDTDVVAGGVLPFEDARAEALAYLRERLARRGDDNAARLANLRLAVLRIESMRAPPAARES